MEEKFTEMTLCDTRCGWLKQHAKYECSLRSYWEQTDRGDGNFDNWFDFYCIACDEKRKHHIDSKLSGVKEVVTCMECHFYELIACKIIECKNCKHTIEQLIIESMGGDCVLFCTFCEENVKYVKGK